MTGGREDGREAAMSDGVEGKGGRLGRWWT